MVARVRLRYAKRGPLRFTSHRDFARAFERALRRAEVPVAFSQGFTPHPRISYASAAPTGVASEAEYLELGLREPVEPADLVRALDAALPPGLDLLEAVAVNTATAGTSLADRMEASRWRIELPGVDPAELRRAATAFAAAEEVPVERLTKQGRRTIDARPAVVMIAEIPSGVSGVTRGAEPPVGAPSGVAGVPCAILECVVRQVTPSVRPDDVLSGLRRVAGLESPVPPRATRLAQGPLTVQGEIVDPLEADRGGVPTGE